MKLLQKRVKSRFIAVKAMVFVAVMLAGAALHAQPMAGTYTVCATTGCDYQSVAAAASDLNSKGVSAAVTINVSAGTYTNSVILYNISGASATNTITFKGAGKNSTKVVVTSGQALYFSSTRYVTFEDFHFENTGSTYGIYLYFAENCTLKNNNIKTQLYTTNFTYTQPISHNYCRSITYENNTITGGYYGVYMYDGSSGTFGYHLFKNNRVTKFYQYGLYMYGLYADGYNVIDGNYIDSALLSNAYGIQAYYQNRVTFKNNIVGPSGLSYALYLYYPNYYNYSGSVPTIVENNILTASYPSGSYPLFADCYYGNYIKIRHNTIHSIGTPTYGCYVYSVTGPLFDFANNSISRVNAGTAAYLYINTTSREVSGNNFYDGTSNPSIYWNGTQYSGLAAYVNGTGHKFSSSVKMPFKSSTDYHLDQSVPAPFGSYLGTDKDMDGDNRCLLYPTSGADESSFGKSAFKAKFFAPSLIYKNSPTSFFNLAKVGEPKIHRWYIDGVLVSNATNLENVKLAGPTHVVSLATVGCGGSDSTWQTVSITTPAAVPVSDFIANHNTISQGEVVSFSDLSSYGPTNWKWAITPAKTFVNGQAVSTFTFIEGTTDSSQNPVVRFNYPGKFQVCLTATNAKGVGNKECKANYIDVSPKMNLGDVSVTNSPAGELYDSGGPTGEATKSGKTKMIIDACASDVYLVLDMFDMMCGYNYLRIYDGTEEVDSMALHPCTTNTTGWASTGLTGGTGWGSNCYNTNARCEPGTSAKGPVDTFHAKSGVMLIVQDINYQWGNGYTPGFKARWWSTPKSFTAPVASFEFDSTICQGGMMNIKNTSTIAPQAGESTFYWDLDGDITTFEDETKDAEGISQWVFTVPGKTTVSLIAENCGGRDTFTANINVFVPNKPNIAFEADNLNPTTSDIVFMTGTMQECVDEYEWTFTHSSGAVKFENGTSQFSENPQVSFPSIGCWSVTLKATNVSGTSTLTKTCYLNVKDAYCAPSVAIMVTDVGISEVNLKMLPAVGSTDTVTVMANSSEQGVKDYTNYVPNKSLALNAEIGVSYLLEVKRNSNSNRISRTAWIDWNLDGDFDDPTEMLGEEINTLNKDWTTTITVPIIAKTGATVLRVASNSGQFSNEVCGQNRFGEYEDYRVYVSNDKTAPIITLFNANGEPATGDTIVIEQGRNFTETGFNAIDNLDGDITSEVTSDTIIMATGATGTLNTFVVRDYGIRYNASDATGNKAKTAMRIIRIIKDTTAPTLEVQMPEIIYVDVDLASSFQMPVVTKVDDLVDGIQVKQKTEVFNDGILVPKVDPAVVDTFEVHYTATDEAGNTVVVIRTIIVQDIVAPMLTLNGNTTIQHPVFTPYTDAGVVINDNYYDPTMLENEYLTITNNVDFNVLGTYVISYCVSDPSGNGPTCASRTVEVIDNEAPVINTTDEDTLVVDVMTKFTYPDITIIDNYFKNGEMDIEITGTLTTNLDSKDNLMKIGDFDLKYTVTDPSQNVSVKSFVVRVVDRVAPEVTLKGEPTVLLCRWSAYEDAGVEIKDNYYTDEADLDIKQEGSFIDKNGTDLEGLYHIRYRVEDASGNVGYSEYREIVVQSPNIAPCTNNIKDSKLLERLISVYPNPSTGNFTVKVGLESQQQLRISVLNLLGEEIAIVKDGQVLSDVYNLDLSTQASGVYMLKVQGADYSFTKRLVIQK